MTRVATSIQRALTLRLLGGLLSVLIAASLGLLLLMRHSLASQFDDALVTKARMLSLFVKQNEQGELEMELDEAPMPEFERPGSGEYFVVSDGHRVLFLSPSLSDHVPSPSPASGLVASGTAFGNVTLPDGRPGRTVWLPFVPRSEAGGAAIGTASQVLVLQVARGRESLDRRLRDLSVTVGLTALVLLLAIPLVIARVIPRSLRPLGDLARQAALIDAQSLQRRFPTDGLPTELSAITARLNELLQRLADSFQRERRFSADVAHELRTPITELRSLAEVALAGPEVKAGDRLVLEDAHDIALQMEGLVTSLLSLSRCQSGHQPMKPEAIDIAAAIARAWEPLERVADSRRLQVSIDPSETDKLVADPALLDSILRNLLGNAVVYTPEGGQVAVSTARDDDMIAIQVANTNRAIDDADLPRMFEAFWRKDAARSDGTHSGLGLALVQAMVRLMGGTVAADLTPPDGLRLVVRLPAAAPPQSVPRTIKQNAVRGPV